MRSAITGDPILSKMLAAKVTFLEDQIFDAKRIYLSRRVFSKSEGETQTSAARSNLKYKGPKNKRPRRMLAFANVDEEFEY
jgi:hypothetical protein